jgi:hypothetical protein
LLVAGVIVQGGNTVVGVVLGVVGFLFMLGGAWLALCVGALVLVRRRTPLAEPTDPAVIVPAT